MKVLYAIQGTGNGHIARAGEIVPALRNRVQTDVLLSGMHTELELDFEVKYKCKGLGFKFGKKGGIDYLNTWRGSDVSAFLREIKAIDLSGYDLVISDFEPVSAWAAKKQHIPCVGLSNQCTLLDGSISNGKGKKSRLARSLLRNYAPTDVNYGFHFTATGAFIHTPVIRRKIREVNVADHGHIAVYLPFYNDKKILKALSFFREKKWIVFSKHSKSPYRHRNVFVYPIDSKRFMEEMATASGVLCGAGFSTTTEAIFLGKKLLVIPMKNQFEQNFNAKALEKLGVPSISGLKKKHRDDIKNWLDTERALHISYPDKTQAIVDQILNDFVNQWMFYRDEFSDIENIYRTIS
ncbi:MAG: glycosyltransferase family protein [Cryomorphaceae bacterium]|nr:glycosyl transferase [Flavobacteriales bacterium]